jgi:hypothetical protein
MTPSFIYYVAQRFHCFAAKAIDILGAAWSKCRASGAEDGVRAWLRPRVHSAACCSAHPRLTSVPHLRCAAQRCPWNVSFRCDSCGYGDTTHSAGGIRIIWGEHIARTPGAWVPSLPRRSRGALQTTVRVVRVTALCFPYRRPVTWSALAVMVWSAVAPGFLSRPRAGGPGSCAEERR